MPAATFGATPLLSPGAAGSAVPAGAVSGAIGGGGGAGSGGGIEAEGGGGDGGEGGGFGGGMEAEGGGGDGGGGVDSSIACDQAMPQRRGEQANAVVRISPKKELLFETSARYNFVSSSTLRRRTQAQSPRLKIMPNKTTIKKTAAGRKPTASTDSNGASAESLPVEATVKPTRAIKPATPRKPAMRKPAPPKSKSVHFTQDDVALRAYFIAEKRQKLGLPGDAHSDWIEAERQLRAESSGKSGGRRN